MTPGSGAIAGLSTEELRATVRALLREVLPEAVAQARVGGHSHAAGVGEVTEEVSVRTDAELAALVRRVAAMCEDPASRAALRDGRRGFRLHGGAGDPPLDNGQPASDGAVIRVDRGAVTERRIQQAADEGARLLLGPRAVLTPLARDKARTLGVVVAKAN